MPPTPPLGRWLAAYRPHVDSDAAAQAAAGFVDAAVSFANIAALVELLELKRAEREKAADNLLKAEKEVQTTVRITTKSAKAASKKLDDMAERMDVIRDQGLLLANNIEYIRLSQWLDELHELQTVKSYLECIAQAQQLITQAHNLLKSSAEKAFDKFKALLAIRESSSSILGSAHNLSEYFDQSIHELRHHFRDTLFSRLRTTLDAMQWPKKQSKSDLLTDTARTLRINFSDLLLLQTELGDKSRSTVVPSVLAVDVMMSYIYKRFHYHFFGKRATNRLEKPEWWVQMLVGHFEDHLRLFEVTIQSILDEADLLHIDAKILLIVGLSNMAWKKLSTAMPVLIQHRHHLCHTISQILYLENVFRKSIDTDNVINGIDGEDIDDVPLDSWMGQAMVIGRLAKVNSWWDAWLSAELNVVQDKAQVVLNASNAWDLVYGDIPVSEDDNRKTNVAERILGIAVSLIERFRQLSNAQYRYQFAAAVLLPLFAVFVIHSHSKMPVAQYRMLGLVTLASASSTTDDKVTTTTIGLLCRYISSLSYVALALEEWGDDIFFLTIWQQSPQYSSSTTLFSSTHASVVQVQNEFSKNLIDQITSTYLSLSNVYRSSRRFALSLVSTYPDDSPLNFSTDLTVAYQYLANTLTTIRQNLTTQVFQTTLRVICKGIEDAWLIWILRSDFSTPGGLLVATDFSMLLSILKRFKTQPELLFPRLREAIILLCLPLEKDDASVSSINNSTTISDVLKCAATNHGKSDQSSVSSWAETHLNIVNLTRNELVQICRTRI